MLTLVVLLAIAPATVFAIIPAIQKVLTMLNNLVTTLDAEEKDDEEKFGHFSAWCNNEMTETAGEIETQQGKIEDTQAVLAQLYSKKGELETSIAKLESDISDTKSQIAEATQKRTEENVNFVKEQTDFDGAIAACAKAVTLLAAHYGDGSGPAEAVKPEFMSLMAIIRKSARSLTVPLGSRRKALSLLQGARPGLRSALTLVQGFGDTINNDRYQASTGEATTIVDQIKVLGQTFAEDKETAIAEEAKLQDTYDKLMDTKSQILTDLQKDLDGTTQRLQQTTQTIAEKEGILARAQKMLADEQAYMASLQENLKDMTEAFEHRKKDRADEKTAVNHALQVLDKYNTFLQKQTNAGRKAQGKKGRGASKLGLKQCPGCVKASSMLMSKAKLFHSSMLEAAASASASLDALDDIIKNLDGLIVRIDEEAKHELEHKEWCEKETGLTTKKREDHSGIVEDIKGILANLQEVVVEKDHGLDVNGVERTDETMTWDDREKLRSEEKNEAEVDVQEHAEAIAALNEAIDILAKYYASKKGAALLQQPGRGGTVVEMLTETRHEFQVGKQTIETDEEEAVDEFTKMKAVHVETETDLTQEKDTLTVEKQSTEQQIYQEEQDLQLNKGEVVSAESYLEQLGKSCYPLLMRYDERVKLRNEEKKAIQDAIVVLKTEA